VGSNLAHPPQQQLSRGTGEFRGRTSTQQRKGLGGQRPSFPPPQPDKVIWPPEIKKARGRGAIKNCDSRHGNARETEHRGGEDVRGRTEKHGKKAPTVKHGIKYCGQEKKKKEIRKIVGKKKGGGKKPAGTLHIGKKWKNIKRGKKGIQKGVWYH